MPLDYSARLPKPRAAGRRLPAGAITDSLHASPENFTGMELCGWPVTHGDSPGKKGAS